MKRFPSYLAACWLLATSPLASAADPLPPVIARYEQMLVRTPAKGTAFEKVYQHFFEGEGVEKLAARWQELADAGGANAANYWLLRGLLSERQGKNDEAIGFFVKVTEMTPGDFQAWTALGELQAGAGKFAAAVAAFQKALANGAPADVRPRLYRQLARSQQRNFDAAGAVKTWQQFVLEAPDDPFVLEEAGEALADAEKFAEARGLFEKLRDRAGTDPYQRVRSVLKLAQLEEQQGHGAKARELYESALPLAAETSWMHREVRSRIEELFRRQDDLPGLTAYYTRWLESHPKDVEAALRLSAALIELNKKTEAVTWLRQAAEWAPERQEVQIALAKRLGETGQPAEAVKILAKQAQARPEEQNLQELLGEAHWLVFEKTKDEAARTAALESWRKLAPPETKDPAWVGRLGDLLRSHRQADLAIVEYRRAIALAPGVSDTQERLVEYLFELERPAEAWKEVETLAGRENADLLRVARIQAKHEAAAWALDTVERGLATEPKNFALLMFRWDLLSDAKRWMEALALFDAMSESAPNAYFLEDIEGRYLLALGAADQAEAFRQERLPKLGAGALSERDLRLLARQALGGGELDTCRKVLDEGRARFADSFPLARLEVDYARRRGDLEARVRGLRRLIELQPKLKADFLRDIVGTWREEGRWDEALAAVQELIAASPAKADAHVLGADVLLAAGRFDDAVTKLREAIKLSDTPNSLRQRLGRIYFEAGQITKAREILDEAFEAAAKPADRLALMPQLAEVYFADGKLDALIERFRQRQRAEDEGWRYALYLAEIFKQTLDHGAARRELARALAARPRDSGLLRQMVKLADEEGSRKEVARYQELWTEAEPSDTNQVALIEALLENQQSAEAFAVLQRQWAAVKKTPGAWDRLLPLLAQQGQLPRLQEMLAAQPGAQSSFETRMQIAIVEAAADHVDSARALFWEIYATPSPALEPAPAAAAAGPGTIQMTSLEQRLSQTYQKRDVVSRILEPDRYGGRNSYSFGGNVLPGKVTAVDDARDTALLYLAALAVKQGKVEAFLTELDRQLVARGDSPIERVLAYSIVQNKPALWRLVCDQALKGKPSLEFDSLCAGQFMSLVQMNQYESDKLVLDRAESLRVLDLYGQRLAQDKRYTPETWQQARLYFYAALGMKEEAKALRQQLLQAADFKNPDQAVQYLSYALETGDRAAVRKLFGVIAELAKQKNASPYLRQTLQYLPYNVIAHRMEPLTFSREELIEILADALELWYPATVPRTAALGGSQQGQYWSAETILPSTRFFSQQHMTVLWQMALSLDLIPNTRMQGANKEGLPVLLRRLEEQANTLPVAEQRIFPRLILLFIDVWSGKKAEAVTRARALLATSPADDDLRMLAAAALNHNKQYKEALALLDQIPPRFGPGNVDLQKLLLANAKLAGETEKARQAALRLTTLRLSQEERTDLAADLRELGLTEKADLISRASAAQPARQGNSVGNTYEALNKAIAEKKKDEALVLARQALTGEPVQMVEYNYLTSQAFEALFSFGQLDTFIEETTASLEKTPDSLRLNFLLANAWGYLERPGSHVIEGPVVKVPCWLRIERQGTKFIGSHSVDGQTWTAFGQVAVSLPEQALAGLVLVGREPALETYAEFSGLQLSPAGDGAAWKGMKIGNLQKPGQYEAADGLYKLRAGGGWIGFDADALQFVHQPAKGDGVLTAQLAATDPDKGFGEAGVMWRGSADPKAPSVAVVAVPGQKVRLKYRLPPRGNAEQYWRRVAELRPDEGQLQRGLAHWLLQIGKKDEAFARYDKLVEKAPDQLMQWIQELVPMYQQAKRLPELAEKVVAWQVSAKNAQQWTWSFSYLAGQMEREKRPDLLEKVCRRGLEFPSGDSGDRLYRGLYQALKAQNKNEEASKVLMDYFSPPGADGKAATQPQLGFRSSQYVDTRPRWLQSVSIGENGVSVGGLQLVDLAYESGELPAIRDRVAAMPAGADSSEQAKPAMLAYIAVKLREAGAVEALRACLKPDLDGTSCAVLIEAVRELKQWPRHEAAALEIYRALRPQMEKEDFMSYGYNSFLRETARLESEQGDPALPATVKTLAESIEKDILMRGARNRRDYRFSDADSCLSLMLRAGMEEDYSVFLDKIKKTPEGSGMGWQYDDERKNFKGDAPKPQVMLWQNDPEEGAPAGPGEFRFEVRREHPYDHGKVFRFMTSRGRSIKGLEKERTLRFQYGRTPEKLETISESQFTVAAGAWRGELPPGGGWLRAVVVEKGADGAEVEFPSPLVPVSRAPNLIKNPAFAGLAQRPGAGKFDLPGWKGLPAGCWGTNGKGPHASGAIYCELNPIGWSDRSDSLLVGERIPVEKGKVYLQTAWVRPIVSSGAEVEVGRRYLNAAGQQIKATWFPSYTAQNWRWHGQRLVPTAEEGADVMPSGTVFIEPVIRVRGGAEWSGLFLGSADAG